MTFYKQFYVISTFISLYIEVISDANPNLSIIRTGLDTVWPNSVGLVFYVDVNNTSDHSYEVELTADQCCLEREDDEDCEALQIIGGCVGRIPTGTSKSLKLIAPLLDPFERKGKCDFFLDSKPCDRKRSTMRDKITITFDTRLKDRKQFMVVPDNIKICDGIDEDPINDCEPVDCETYYNGKRSYFDRKQKRCAEIPICLSNVDGDTPIYEPISNKCVKENVITKDDLDFIKELSGDIRRTQKDILIIENVHATAPSKTINTEASKEERLLMTNIAINKFRKLKDKYLNTAAKKYILENKYTLAILGIVICIQCCLICTIVLFFSRKCLCFNKKKVIRKFFNYRQDASVTTPLICTSNIDTETTEFQYTSDSSNADRKIKCYKACQKERKNNIKMSMSDDILSKCLTRRDWCKPKPEAIPEITLQQLELTDKSDEKNDEVSVQKKESSDKKKSDVKVNFENEIIPKVSESEKKHNKFVRSIVKKLESKSKDKKEKSNYSDSQFATSEKELKCHSYDHSSVNSNTSAFQKDKKGNLDIFRVDNTKRGTISLSTEKGAQAAFSNDSIDDFLSERGMIYLAGENLSKYSISSESNEVRKSSVSSEMSGKTSKNNIVKNVLSLLHKKSKQGPSSDPGMKKNSQNLDMELIHMSHASTYSSSNNNSDYIKGMKRTKDSRTSL